MTTEIYVLGAMASFLAIVAAGYRKRRLLGPDEALWIVFISLFWPALVAAITTIATLQIVDCLLKRAAEK